MKFRERLIIHENKLNDTDDQIAEYINQNQEKFCKDSQMIGKIHFDLALYSFGGDVNLPLISREYLSPLKTYNKMPHNAMKLNPSGIITPYSHSVMSDNKSCTLSTLKQSEDGRGLIARYYNGKDQKDMLELHLSTNPSIVSEVNLNEEQLKVIETSEKNNNSKSYKTAILEMPINTVKSVYFEK